MAYGLGKQVRHEELTAGNYKMYKNELPDGIYFYTIKDREGARSRQGKIVIQ
jgi:hypothetical protein